MQVGHFGRCWNVDKRRPRAVRAVRRRVVTARPTRMCYAHENVIENRKREVSSKCVVHHREIQAEPHPVLMPFAVVHAWRKFAATIKIDVERELTY